MPSFGRYGCFPMRFGGGKRAIQQIHEALLAEYAPGFDTSEDTIANIEAYAEASVIAAGLAATNRLRNQGQPLKMCENLPVWEEVTKLHPLDSDATIDRRRALAGKLRGVSGNTLTDIRDTLAALAPNNFVQVHTTAAADEITYWPVEYPGPPGFEWSSNRLKLRIEMNMNGITRETYQRLISTASQQLDAMLPAWMTFSFFVDDTGSSGVSGFHVGHSHLGVTGL